MTSIALDRAATDTTRVAGFDLLRGLCAIGVALYHSLAWGGAAHIYNLGTYGVYIFFALSGASMYVAYAERFERGFPVGRFLVLRFIRLAPLYFLGLAIACGYGVYKGSLGWQEVAEAALNVLFVFGLGNPGTTSQVVGGWSIGIEFVFYLLFPVMLAITASRRWLWFVALAFVAQHVFISTVLAGGTMDGRWPAYTQFLAFVFYFAAGCAIGRALRFGLLPNPPALLFVACIATLALTSGPTSEYTITGLLGMTLSLVAVIAVATSASLRFGHFGLKACDVLGRCSYGVYILHPWVLAAISYAGRKVGADVMTVGLLTVAASVPLALLVERWLEKPAQRALKSLAHRSHHGASTSPR
jgi:exopolysaccharide production protein ExoZ